MSALAALNSVPAVTRLLVLLLVGASAFVALLRASAGSTDFTQVFRGGGDATLPYPWLVVVPGNVIYYPWTLLSAAFIEVNIIEFTFSAVALALGGRYLERVWGQAEFLKFVFVVAVLSNAMSALVNAGQEFVLGDVPWNYLYGMSYYGLMGLQTGFLVAFTQLIPEHQVQLLGGLAKLRVKRLPMLYVGFSNVMCLIGYQSPFLLIQFGWLVSWAWLRFFKYNEGNDFRGDRSDTFTFANWFPPFVQPYIATASGTVFSLLVRLRILPAWSASDMETGYAHTAGGQRAEAERRRALALKALDQRVAAKPPRPPPQAATSLSQSQPAPTTSSAAGPSSPALPTEVIFDATKNNDTS